MIEQYLGPGVLHVPGRREQNDLATAGEFQQMRHRFDGRRHLELVSIPAGELFETLDLMPVPLAEPGAGSDVFEPLVEMRIGPSHSPRPEPIDQNPRPPGGPVFVNAMDGERQEFSRT